MPDQVRHDKNQHPPCAPTVTPDSIAGPTFPIRHPGLDPGPTFPVTPDLIRGSTFLRARRARHRHH